MKKPNFINSKGISVLFLVIAMLLIVAIGYVFSYLIPTKQKSVIFPIQSTQAYFIAQSGVEYAVRYATSKNWRTTTDLLGLNAAGVNQKNLGAGRFTITYTNTAPNLDTLFSVGEVPSGTERRRISVTNFTSFMQQGLVLRIAPPTYPAPCMNATNEVTFYIYNIGSSSITLNAFRANWDPYSPDRTINRVRFTTTDRWTGTYANGAARTSFTSNQTITTGTTIRVRIRWSSAGVSPYFPNLIIYFYDASGKEYTFSLDPDENGVPTC